VFPVARCARDLPYDAAMLRIKEQQRRPDTVLTLEGDLIGAWVDELARTCAQAHVAAGTLTIDLAAVGFVDQRGLDLLRSLQRRGASLLNVSSFVGEQLKAAAR